MVQVCNCPSSSSLPRLHSTYDRCAQKGRGILHSGPVCQRRRCRHRRASIDTATSQHPIETYQTLGVDIADHSYTSTINNQYAWWGATDPQLDEGVQQRFDYEYQDCAGLLTPLLHQLSPLIVHKDDDTDTGPVWRGTDLTTYCEKISEITEPSNLLTTTSTHPDLPDILKVEPPSSSRKRRRKQNHSCDPCRLAKRACDLSLSVDIQNLKPS